MGAFGASEGRPVQNLAGFRFSRDRRTNVELHRFRSIFPIFLLLPLLGCASLSPRSVPITSNSIEGCQAFFTQIEDQVKEAGVRDASSYPIPGFSYLRTNRFLSALKNRVKDGNEREQWLGWMKTLDRQAREKEISNLPDERVLSLQTIETVQPNRSEVYARMESCSEKLFNRDKALPDFNALLASRMDVPDEYSLWRRAIGFYLLMVFPVAIVGHNAQVKSGSWFETNLDDLPVTGQLRAYVPGESLPLDEKGIQEMMDQFRINPLGVPLPDENRGKELAGSFAPAIIQDIAAPYDRIGKVRWRDDHLETDSETPAVYYYFSHAFLEGKPILQINYAIWYSERAGKTPPWIEKGHMDGLTLRVSLDLQGKPFMIDVMNNCGCYHLFAPARDRVERIVSKPFKPDPFVPQWLPMISFGNHLGIRINSGWHQVERLFAIGKSSESIPYELLPYRDLEALPHADGRTESIFDCKGIVKGSQRVERFILFSMGIPKIGSMRQRGHHAIDLIGRTHFDDPNLFDHDFIFKEAE